MVYGLISNFGPRRIFIICLLICRHSSQSICHRIEIRHRQKVNKWVQIKATPSVWMRSEETYSLLASLKLAIFVLDDGERPSG
jgi:hypothetical protein